MKKLSKILLILIAFKLPKELEEISEKEKEKVKEYVELLIII